MIYVYVRERERERERETDRQTERKERQSSVNYLYPSRQVVTTVYLVARMKSQAVQRKCSRHHDLFSTLTTGGTTQNVLDGK